jgi:uncharacterized protein YbjT (DUF2867 family)
MKIVVIGGTGLIGTKLVKGLQELNHAVVVASPSTGGNTITGEGLDTAFEGADIVVDVANSPSFEDQAVLDFFETAGRNIFAAERKAGVKFHVALSVVGTDRIPESGYLRAKDAQEKLIRASGIPYTIVRATQFFEFLKAIADAGTQGDTIHLSTAFIQPIASDDVAAAVLSAVLEAPKNDVVEIGGPDRMTFTEIIQKYLDKTKDPRKVLADDKATYFGAQLTERALVPEDNAYLGTINFEEWYSKQ